MLTLRRAADRGHADHGWLNSYHTFSFADYFDPAHMGFRSLRVINDDTVDGGQGFGTHGHRDMEIVSYVLDGRLEHKDSMGTGSVLKPGDVQRMSAGTGVRHSEFNGSQTDPVHFLQIWIVPNKQGVAPSYEEKHFDEASRRGQLRLIASPDGAEGSVRLHADARIRAALLGAGENLEYVVPPGRHTWVHVARGDLNIQGQRLTSGDAVSTSDEATLKFEATQDSEVLLFDLA